MKILCIQTGGTIDKDYPKSTQGWAFEIGEPAIKDVLENYKHTLEVDYEPLLRKDSTEITEEDRLLIEERIKSSDATRIIITHGTDSIVETGEFLSDRNLGKIIVLTGSSLPAKFKDSDAPINIGLALGAVQVLDTGVYLAIHGLVLPIKEVSRNMDTGLFIKK